MRIIPRALLAALIGLTFATPAVTSAQTPDMRQTLGGLLTGIRTATTPCNRPTKRGYQRGRADEARQSRRGPGEGGSYQDRGGFSNSR